MSGKETLDWQPEGWADWTHEKRRIWRLERRLLRWEAISIAAASLAERYAGTLAELRGEAAPTPREIFRQILEERSRRRVAKEQIDLKRLLESEDEEKRPSSGP